MSKILLLGGTGVMGVNLCRKLARRGHDVWVTTRWERADVERVHFVKGNAKDITFLRNTLRSIKSDAVIDFMSYGSDEFSVRKDLLLSGTGQYMFLSSCRVFAGEEVHTEKSPRLLDVCQDADYLKTDEYALAKARSENMLRDSGRRNWTIVRPCITYAYPRLQFGCLESTAFLHRVTQGLVVPMPLEMMHKKTTMLHGDDVAEMIARLVLNERAIGEDFNTVTSENHTWEDVAEIYSNAIGLKVAVCSLADYKTFCSPYQVLYGRLVHHRFDNSKILSATGMKQGDLSTLRGSLMREAIRYLQNPSEVHDDVRCNALMDRVLKTRFRISGGCREWLFYNRVRYPWFGRMLAVASKIK